MSVQESLAVSDSFCKHITSVNSDGVYNFNRF